MNPDAAPTAPRIDPVEVVHAHLDRVLWPLRGLARAEFIHRALSPDKVGPLTTEVLACLQATAAPGVDPDDVRAAVLSWGARFVAIAAHLTSDQAERIRGDLAHSANRAARTATGSDAVRLAIAAERWLDLIRGASPEPSVLHASWFEAQSIRGVALTEPGAAAREPQRDIRSRDLWERIDAQTPELAGPAEERSAQESAPSPYDSPGRPRAVNLKGMAPGACVTVDRG